MGTVTAIHSLCERRAQVAAARRTDSLFLEMGDSARAMCQVMLSTWAGVMRDTQPDAAPEVFADRFRAAWLAALEQALSSS